MDRTESLEELMARVRQLQAEGKLPTRPTFEQRVSWCYGQTALSGSTATREQVEAWLREKDAEEGGGPERTKAG